LTVLAVLVLTLAMAGALLAVTAVWRGGPSVAHGNAVGTATAFIVASAQVSALVLRRSDRDRTLLRWLFAVSCLFAAVAATMFTVLLWAEFDSERYGRVLAAVVVLDILAVVLQPTLARARPNAITIRLRLLLESGEIRDMPVMAPDLAAAAAAAIRQSEREGHRVVRLEVAERHREPSSG
jgi:hypothetical protein